MHVNAKRQKRIQQRIRGRRGCIAQSGGQPGEGVGFIGQQAPEPDLRNLQNLLTAPG